MGVDPNDPKVTFTRLAVVVGEGGTLYAIECCDVCGACVLWDTEHGPTIALDRHERWHLERNEGVRAT